MSTPAQKKVRCAVYCRKSSEEGLELEFNSLDAQRDAGLSYIQSQKHEGWIAIPAPPPRAVPPLDRMRQASGTGSELWAVALAPGAPGWCVLQTAPLELLCEPSVAGPPRIAALSRALATEAFQLNCYDSVALLLLEASAAGDSAVSGFCLDDPAQYRKRMPRTIEEATPHFSLIHAPLELPKHAEAAWLHTLASLGGPAAALFDNTAAFEHLLPHHPLPAPARSLYFRRADVPIAPEPASVHVLREPGRIRVRFGGGEVWFSGKDSILRFEAVDRESGARFLAATAAWLGLPLPPPPAEPGIPGEVVALSASEPDGSMSFAIGENLGIAIRISGDGERATMSLPSPLDRERLLPFLAPILRDGPPAARRRGRPLVPELTRIWQAPHRPIEACMVGESFCAGVWGDDRTLLRRVDAPGAPTVAVTELEGFCAGIADVGAAVAMVQVLPPAGRRGIGFDDPHRIVLVDPQTGASRVLSTSAGADPRPGWSIYASPRGDSIAVAVRVIGQLLAQTRVIAIPSGAVVWESDLSLGLVPRAWE
ncbi:MAG: hypothetical protein NT062_24940, partial [Proteobacteria bacterium]|nr:hypothetical protein [Pseudomonadota bacterium]